MRPGLTRRGAGVRESQVMRLTRPFSSLVKVLQGVVKRAAERALHARIYRILPHGVEELADATRFGLLANAEIVFDIGANVGNTVRSFLDACPSAQIYAFEPAADTHRILATRYRQESRVTTYDVGLSDTAGQSRIDLNVRHFLRQIGEHGTPVEITTIDEFCAVHAIDRIDYLKVDTEGHDLAVIRGGRRMLEATTIVQAEVSMNPDNKRHVPFEEIKSHLEHCGFRLFGLYEQFTPPEELFLRRANAVFLSTRALASRHS
jgi:FkbM family methyltransferase